MSTENFMLEWRTHKETLASNLRKILGAQEFVDVTLVSEGHFIRCHRLVLSANSTFFDSILQGTEGNYPIVILPSEIKQWHMEGLVDFMYLGEVTIHKTQLNDFLKSAETLKIRGLIDSPELFTDGKEENALKKNDVEEKIEPNQPDTKLRTALENSQQVVSTTTNDSPVVIRDLNNDVNLRIKECGTQGPPPAYQERISNNTGGHIQSSRPQERSISHAITRPFSEHGNFEKRTNNLPQEVSVSLTSTDGNSSMIENPMKRPHIKTPASTTLTAGSPSIGGNTNNLPNYFENPMNRRFLVSDQTVPPDTFEMLRRINSPAPVEKRARLTHPPQLYSEAHKGYHFSHLLPTVPPKMPPLKRHVMPKNVRGPAKTTPGSQQLQQFNIPSNYGPPPMRLPHPQPTLPGLMPSSNTHHPQLHPHPSIYLHPNFRAFANNFKM